MNKGNLFIVSAPSGAGKSTILKKVLAAIPRVAFSVSHTTRKPRANEQDGVDYHFTGREQFLRMRDNGEFLEWAEVHGNFYGSSRMTVFASLTAGIDILLDIDVQGARQLRQTLPEAASVFIVPPSWDELEKRLTGRGTDAPETITLRLSNARREMQDIGRYDYVVLNDNIDEAAAMVQAIILAARSRNRRNGAGLPLLIDGLTDEDSCQHANKTPAKSRT